MIIAIIHFFKGQCEGQGIKYLGGVHIPRVVQGEVKRRAVAGTWSCRREKLGRGRWDMNRYVLLSGKVCHTNCGTSSGEATTVPM